MLIHLILFFFLLILLFAISKKISNQIYAFFFLLTNSQKLSVIFLSAIFLPGTIIHEVSHFILATLLRVPTGELSVLPKLEKSGEVKAGKLEIGDVDPFRRTLIGLSPMIAGLIIIYLIGFYFFPRPFSLTTYNLQPITLLGLYLLFAVSATMFSSKKDLESLIIAGPITLLILIAFYFLGVRVFFSEKLIVKIDIIVRNLNFYLGFACGVDVLIFTLLHLKVIFWQKVLRKKIV